VFVSDIEVEGLNEVLGARGAGRALRAEDRKSLRACVPWRAAHRRRLPRAIASREEAPRHRSGGGIVGFFSLSSSRSMRFAGNHEIAQVRLDDEQVEPPSLHDRDAPAYEPRSP